MCQVDTLLPSLSPHLPPHPNSLGWTPLAIFSEDGTFLIARSFDGLGRERKEGVCLLYTGFSDPLTHSLPTHPPALSLWWLHLSSSDTLCSGTRASALQTPSTFLWETGLLASQCQCPLSCWVFGQSLLYQHIFSFLIISCDQSQCVSFPYLAILGSELTLILGSIHKTFPWSALKIPVSSCVPKQACWEQYCM